MKHCVTFEQAKRLKEKGFNEYCNQYYSQALFEGINEDWEGVFPKYTVFKHSDFHFNSKPQGNDLWFECSAPEQHQVIEWLLENHGIWVELSLSSESKYLCLLRNIKTPMEHIGFVRASKYSSEFSTPQEAYSAAFDYILDNNLID